MSECGCQCFVVWVLSQFAESFCFTVSIALCQILRSFHVLTTCFRPLFPSHPNSDQCFAFFLVCSKFCVMRRWDRASLLCCERIRHVLWILTPLFPKVWAMISKQKHHKVWSDLNSDGGSGGRGPGKSRHYLRRLQWMLMCTKI